MKKFVLAFLLFASPALAQTSPAEVRALHQTVNELTQAWIGARSAFLDEQDKNAEKDAEIKQLKDKLPRQEPVRGPSGKPNPDVEGKAP